MCDIIVSIIGGRYGTESKEIPGNSITQTELRHALTQGIQVYIFIEKNIYAEYSTYMANKGNDNVNYYYVDDKRIYDFIENVHSLPQNNPITTFETSSDISRYLREQWAGLFQYYLQHTRRIAELKVLDEMKSVSATLREMVSYLTEREENQDSALETIISWNHPLFRSLAALTKTNHRVFFLNHTEMEQWILSRGWRKIENEPLDADSIEEWMNNDGSGYIKFTHDIFKENGRLRVINLSEWKDEWVKYIDNSPPTEINFDYADITDPFADQ